MCILPAGDGLDSSLPSAGVKEQSLMVLSCCEAGVSERKIMPLLKRIGKVKIFGSMLEIAASVGT